MNTWKFWKWNKWLSNLDSDRLIPTEGVQKEHLTISVHFFIALEVIALSRALLCVKCERYVKRCNHRYKKAIFKTSIMILFIWNIPSNISIFKNEYGDVNLLKECVPVLVKIYISKWLLGFILNRRKYSFYCYFFPRDKINLHIFLLFLCNNELS